MKKSKILALVMALTVATSCFVGCSDDKENNSNGEKGSTSQSTFGEENSGENNANGDNSSQTNDDVKEYITFGKYEQDNNEENGKEDIEWLVLEKKIKRCLL